MPLPSGRLFGLRKISTDSWHFVGDFFRCSWWFEWNCWRWFNCFWYFWGMASSFKLLNPLGNLCEVFQWQEVLCNLSAVLPMVPWVISDLHLPDLRIRTRASHCWLWWLHYSAIEIILEFEQPHCFRKAFRSPTWRPSPSVLQNWAIPPFEPSSVRNCGKKPLCWTVIGYLDHRPWYKKTQRNWDIAWLNHFLWVFNIAHIAHRPGTVFLGIVSYSSLRGTRQLCGSWMRHFAKSTSKVHRLCQNFESNLLFLIVTQTI